MDQTFLTRLHLRPKPFGKRGYSNLNVSLFHRNVRNRCWGLDVINLCANNYLGLANHPELKSLRRRSIPWLWSCVRAFHLWHARCSEELESRLSRFLGTEDTIPYSSAFDANGGLFETILGPEDAVISDARSCQHYRRHSSHQGKRFRYANNDMDDLERQLQAADATNTRVKRLYRWRIFHGRVLRKPRKIVELAQNYGALTMIDDCMHRVSGRKGRGTAEHCDVLGKIDVITGTQVKPAAHREVTSGRKEIIAWLRQRSRPYLFQHARAGHCCDIDSSAEHSERDDSLREKLADNTRYFRERMTAEGFGSCQEVIRLSPSSWRCALGIRHIRCALKRGIYVIGFVPVCTSREGEDRTQMSAAHDRSHLDTTNPSICRGWEIWGQNESAGEVEG